MSNLQVKKDPQTEKGAFHINVNSRPKVVNQESSPSKKLPVLRFQPRMGFKTLFIPSLSKTLSRTHQQEH